MGIFSSIIERLRNLGRHGSPQSGTPQRQQTQEAPYQPGQAIQNVDIEAVLRDLAAKKGEKLNWRESIVDLLKLLDLDSSLDARKELAEELNIHAGPHGSAEQNIALHRAVMRKVAENGGKVPDSLKT